MSDEMLERTKDKRLIDKRALFIPLWAPAPKLQRRSKGAERALRVRGRSLDREISDTRYQISDERHIRSRNRGRRDLG